MSDLIEKLEAWLSREQETPGVDASEGYGLERMLDLLKPVIEAAELHQLEDVYHSRKILAVALADLRAKLEAK